MKNKDRYFQAFIQNNGKLNEIELGQYLGMNEDETRAILAQLLAEYKIEYITNRACEYRLIRKEK